MSSQSSAKMEPVVPLDTAVLTVKTKNGERRVSALSIGFMKPRKYVAYKTLPTMLLSHQGTTCSDELICEWKERAKQLLHDLSWLLGLSHQRFWCQAIHDQNLHRCLQTFLTRTPRDYDFNDKGSEDLLQLQRQLYRRVLIVLIRMATYRESKTKRITQEGFAHLIYDNFVFDIPRMMDICAVYGFANSRLISRMISHLFKNQPLYFNDLHECIPSIVQAFRKIEETAGVVAPSDQRKSEPLLPQKIPGLVNYIADVSATLYCFLESCEAVREAFHLQGFERQIPSFYHTIIPFVTNTLLPKIVSEIYEPVKRNLSFSKWCLVNAFRSLIASCCIDPMLSLKCENSGLNENAHVSLLNYFHELMSEISNRETFLEDYNKLFPIEEDLSLFLESGISVNNNCMEDIMNKIEKLSLAEQPNTNEAEQDPKNLLVKESPVAPQFQDDLSHLGAAASCSTKQPASTDLNTESVQTVLDVFPDLAKDFVQACLKYYNFDPESVVNAILSSSLPETLQKQQTQSTQQEPELPKAELHRSNIYDYDEFDVFHRQDVSLDRMRHGKQGKTQAAHQEFKTEKDSQFLKDMILQYETNLEEEEIRRRQEEVKLLYDDEFDDEFEYPINDDLPKKKFRNKTFFFGPMEDLSDGEEEDEDDNVVSDKSEQQNSEKQNNQPQPQRRNTQVSSNHGTTRKNAYAKGKSKSLHSRNADIRKKGAKGFPFMSNK